MACARDTTIITNYLDRVLNNTLVRTQDQGWTLSYIGQQESNKYLVFDYVLNNYDKITDTWAFDLSFLKDGDEIRWRLKLTLFFF